jgi:cysteine desulfurase family protein (TIGR01976 family)
MSFTSIESQRSRADFPALARTENGRPIAYLDGPAGTQVPEAVLDAIRAYYTTANANTHGEFETSRASDRWMHEVREAAAAFVGAPSWREISFGANMTSLNFSLSRAIARSLQPGDEIVITQLDHESNRGPWLNLRERGVEVREVALREDGRLDPEDFERKVGAKTRLVALGHASNALGTVNDLALARRLSRAVGAWMLVDAVHSAAHFPLDVQALDADFLLCSAYKFYGPHIGILYCRPGRLEELQTDKLIVQDDEGPYRIETGTLNHASLAGVKAAIDYVASWGEGATLRERIVSAMTGIAAYEHGVASHYYERLKEIPGVKVWGPDFSSPERAPTVSITHPRVSAEELASRAGKAGIQVWNGHFYAVKAIEQLEIGRAHV